MPFKRISRNKYRSPSGRTYTARQIRYYYANKGFPKKRKRRKRRR